MLLREDIYRVFFSARDAENRSSVGYVDYDLERRQIVGESYEPVIEHGPDGSFYSHGISIGNLYTVGDHSYILFMGWQIPVGGHWFGEVGRLRLTASVGLELDSQQPHLGLCVPDPVSLSYPWVLHENGVYHMWYGSTVQWNAGNGEMEHVIKYASSRDGMVWRRGNQAVPSVLGFAQAFSRPTVIHDTEGYHMWFSYRSGLPGKKYRIGYAWGASPLSFELRLDEAGIDVSESGWDSEMIEYPFVWEHKKRLYMLYNGNGYGQTGFGLAIQENSL